jgi:hypothetical protein
MQAVLDVDGQLRSHEPHLRYRLTQYQETKRAIEDVEGSVADFARVRMRCCLGAKYRPVAAASFRDPVSDGCAQPGADALPVVSKPSTGRS